MGNSNQSVGQNKSVADHPILSSSFDLEKNYPLATSSVPLWSPKKFWWLCDLGHSYEASVRSRNYSQSGCPFCSNQKVLSGFNDLETTHPELARQFDAVRNELSPREVSSGAKKRVWWICEKNHSYQTSVSKRTTRSHGCPVCSNRVIIEGVNDMATTHPELAAEFDLQKNAGLSPKQLNAGTHKDLYWICKRGHSYRCKGTQRLATGRSCPYCSNQKVLEGFNDMASQTPRLIEYFNFVRNHPHTPFNLTSHTGKELWWTCRQGHEFQAPPSNLLKSKVEGCPYCSNRYVLAGFNDLKTTHPQIAAEWHSTKNKGRLPSEFTAGSGRQAWFLCPEGHEYISKLANRLTGRNCPGCAAGGFDATKEGYLYNIQNLNLMAGKVGISNFKRRRIDNYPTGWAVRNIWFSESGSLIRRIEKELLGWIRLELKLPPFLEQSDLGNVGGATETYSLEALSGIWIENRVWEIYKEISNYDEFLELVDP